MLDCPSLSSPSPTRWKFRRIEALGGLRVISAQHPDTPHHPQGRVFSHGYLSAPTSPAADTGTSASRRPVNRLPDRGHGFFIPCCALSPAREEWEAASVQAGLRARRFAEKQYTRRLVIPWALLGGQLCSKWWMMREIRQSRDTPQWRDSEESWWRGGDEYNRKPLCVYETL